MIARRGMTATITCAPKDTDLTTAVYVYMTLQQGGVRLTKSGTDLAVSSTGVSGTLTQEETLGFEADTDVELQLNWIWPDGNRGESDVVLITFGQTLLPYVLPGGLPEAQT